MGVQLSDLLYSLTFTTGITKEEVLRVHTALSVLDEKKLHGFFARNISELLDSTAIETASNKPNGNGSVTKHDEDNEVFSNLRTMARIWYDQFFNTLFCNLVVSEEELELEAEQDSLAKLFKKDLDSSDNAPMCRSIIKILR